MMKQIFAIYKEISAIAQNEKGSAIVIALITLVAMTILGIIASMISQTETQIATNDMLYKKAFYSADGGAEITRELIEQSLGCPEGFPDAVLTPSTYGKDGNVLDLNKFGTNGTILQVTDPAFAYQDGEYLGPGSALVASVDDNGDGINNFPADDERDLRFVDPPYTTLDDADGTPHTNVVAFGDTKLSTGSAIQMAAGYSGKGKGAGGGGAQIVYQIHSAHEYRARGSLSYIMVEYRHMIGQEGECQY